MFDVFARQDKYLQTVQLTFVGFFSVKPTHMQMLGKFFTKCSDNVECGLVCSEKSTNSNNVFFNN